MTSRRSVQHFPVSTPVRCGQLDEEWRTNSACRQGHDPEIWYPHNPREAWLGVAICRTCPVARDCLLYAMAHNERFGTWGGFTEWQRGTRRLTAAM